MSRPEVLSGTTLQRMSLRRTSLQKKIWRALVRDILFRAYTSAAHSEREHRAYPYNYDEKGLAVALWAHLIPCITIH